MPATPHAPYRHVEVIGFHWDNAHPGKKGENGQTIPGILEEVNMVLHTFKTYNFTCHRQSIPTDKDKRASFQSGLKTKIAAYAAQKPAGRTLVILYYQGYGGKDKSSNSLMLHDGHGDKGQFMPFSEMANAVIDAKCDVLTILNCGHAGAAVSAQPKQRPNYENCNKEIIAAMPSGHDCPKTGYMPGFASALEQALREHRTTWSENGFKGTPHHFAHAIRGINEKRTPKGKTGPPAVERFPLVAPPAGAASHPIVMGFMSPQPQGAAGPAKK